MLGIELIGNIQLPTKIPNFEKIEFLRIGEDIKLPPSYFAHCTNLRSVEIIKPLKIIPSKLFMGCNNIEIVKFLLSCKNININLPSVFIEKIFNSVFNLNYFNQIYI